MKTIDQLNREFAELMEANGFRITGRKPLHGDPIYEREWDPTDLGECYRHRVITYRIEASISFGFPLIRIMADGREIDRRDYSSPKRAINAMREILRNIGLEL